MGPESSSPGVNPVQPTLVRPRGRSRTRDPWGPRGRSTALLCQVTRVKKGGGADSSTSHVRLLKPGCCVPTLLLLCFPIFSRSQTATTGQPQPQYASHDRLRVDHIEYATTSRPRPRDTTVKDILALLQLLVDTTLTSLAASATHAAAIDFEPGPTVFLCFDQHYPERGQVLATSANPPGSPTFRQPQPKQHHQLQQHLDDEPELPEPPKSVQHSFSIKGSCPYHHHLHHHHHQEDPKTLKKETT